MRAWILATGLFVLSGAAQGQEQAVEATSGVTDPAETPAADVPAEAATAEEPKAPADAPPDADTSAADTSAADTSAAEISAPEGEAATPFSAQSDEERAKSAFYAGDDAYREGDYEKALEHFEKAWILSGRNAMLFNLANAYERLDRYREASLALAGYIPSASPASRPTLLARKERLDRKAAAVEARNDELIESLRAKAALYDEVKDERRVSVRQAWGWSAVGFGALSLGAGIGLTINAALLRGDLKDECVEEGGLTLCTPEQAQRLDSERAQRITGYSLLAVGAVSEAVGLWLVLKKPKEESANDATVAFGFTPGRVLLKGSF